MTNSDSGMIEVRGVHISPAEIIRVLEPFVSENRRKRIDQVLNHRTYTVTPVIEGVHDMGNVSAVMRSAEALGYQSVHVIETAEAFKRSSRTTQGADKWLDVHRWPTAADCVAYLHEKEYSIVATHLEADESIENVDFTAKTALVFGNEATGLSDEMLSLADRRCILPMRGFVESFNISVAAAVILYHAFRQRMGQIGRQGDLTEPEKERLKADFYMKSVKEPEALISRLASNDPKRD